MRKFIKRVLGLLVILAALGLFAVRWKISTGVTPVARGERVAAKLGCFNCHGAGGAGGVGNPGAQGGIPPWSAAAATEGGVKPGDLESWVLDAKPATPPAEASSEEPLVAMPAYRGLIRPAELTALLAYLRAKYEFDAPPESAANARAGYLAARDAGCFGCHGPSGRGLAPNPRSLAGYIPSWEGPVYADLVKDDAELDEWIRTGKSGRLLKNPIAKHFLARQKLEMPPYDGNLEDAQIERIKDYIRWMRATEQ